MPDLYSEKIFWSHLNSSSLRYWPVALKQKDTLTEEIESEIPVTFSMAVYPFQSIKVQAEPLHVWLVLVWGNITWYVAPDGRIWDGQSPVSKFVCGEQKPDVPVWYLKETFPTPAEGFGETNKVVYRSVLPLESLRKWVQEIEKINWGGTVSKVVLGRRAGSYSFIIQVKWKEKYFTVLLDERVERWFSIAQALPQILKDSPAEYNHIEIDATYEEKIVVKAAI
ncbi:MAG TPA: hypothetical protein DEP01_07860 [Aminobacterium sp.]|jgi:hypothetical protein|uniref:hypothetical protein n=1 Tax=Aminobacterium TaxID=81466 RepID=UPI000ECC8728|nr:MULTISPECIES: hypothetical protein [unclassified Aminobacterium]HCA41389.1 hypothetical protein [Aminobacterium sp.]